VTEAQCRDSEYGYLFEQYGITGATPGLFTNVQISNYWSSTEYVQAPDGEAWRIAPNFPFPDFKFQRFSAWAVRSGDVAAVPLPAAAWLFGTALGLLGWPRRKAS
jgi:hypothetical protein